jgi:hypothetical protein
MAIPEEVEKALAKRGIKSPEELRKVFEVVERAEGKLVSLAGFEPGDDICPTWRFPHGPGWLKPIEQLVQLGGVLEVFPLGIPVVEHILVQARFQSLAR